MAEKIIMPQLGESIAEGTIVKWLKAPGDTVKKDENVLIISTDKVEAEIPSPKAGVLVSIDVQAGTTVAVGTILGYVGDAGEKGAAPKQEAAVPTPPPAPAPAPVQQTPVPVPAPALAPVLVAPPVVSYAPASSGTTASGFISPLVRRIMTENSIFDSELGRIRGSGRDGRVNKNDIQAYVIHKNVQIPQPNIVIPAGQSEVTQPVSTMRRVIMENMLASRKTSAHVTTFFEIDYTKIDAIRLAHKERFLAEEGVNLTYTTFLAFAVCQVLKRHPFINAEIKGDKIVFKKSIHLGMAVAITEPEPGLMVPVMRNADQMNLRGLARSIAGLAQRTRTKKIKPDELSGGTFTITNPGNYGAVIGTPIINQPQVAILGVGNIQKKAVVVEIGGADAIAIRKMGWLALSFDHRLIDGATADIFMADLKQTLENWSTTP